MCSFKHISVALLLLSLVACSGTAPRDLKPWEKTSGSATDQGSSADTRSAKPDYGPKLAVGKPYTVKRGDTLYAIAFRLGVDFRELAARNGIRAPYTIKVGQVLQTSKPAAAAANKSSKTSGAGKSTTTRTASSKPQSSAIKSKTTPGKATSSSSPATKVAKKTQSSKKASSSKLVEPTRPVSRWRWPSRGKVVRTFASNVHKGIDIAGSRGDPVTATAAGKVVYAGAGVTGYGSLIIVKHNDTYLSAYGHNEQLLVSEGSVVKVGQQIATMGSSGTNSVKLHFELRRLGKPVDPLTLLPKR
jgi:lipoprotein NlpD